MEQEKAVASCANAQTALRRHFNRPPSLFDRHEAIELPESLVRLARTQAHDKAEEYSAALDEVKARQAYLESGHLQRLMLGLVGDPLRAKMAKEATSILKGVSRSQPSETLQRFSGKVISFSLAILGSKLYVREVFKAISRHSGSSRPTVKLEANLRAEIEYWRFLDDWKDCFQWRTEHHASVTLCSDASKTVWGGTLRLGGHTLESRDYWLDNSQDINVLEAQALLYSLLSFRKHLTSSRVDVYTDNRVLKSALENGGCRSSEVNGVLKDIFVPAGNTISVMVNIRCKGLFLIILTP